MILGIGTDIIEIARISRAVGNENFRRRVFSDLEQNYCESRGAHSAASYAARFAAKEAFFKAIGTGIVTNLAEVEVRNDAAGQPKIFLHGGAKALAAEKNIAEIFLSLSHSREYATAVAVVTA